MKLGYLTDYSPKEVEFAAKAGFECLSLFIQITTVENEKPDYWKRVVDECRGKNIAISALAAYFDHLNPDETKRKRENKAFMKIMEIAGRYGIDVVATNTWGDRDKTVEQNMPGYKQVFGEYAKAANANGVKIAMENCPHFGGYPMKIGNISYSPETWEMLFDAVPDKAIGLEYDPSHLVWLFVDYLKAARDFISRIYHVHAKDTEVFRDKLAKKSILGQGWWRYRLPGMGEVNWVELFRMLKDRGYKGGVVIEHEDPLYEGEKRNDGLKIGLRNLKEAKEKAGWTS